MFVRAAGTFWDGLWSFQIGMPDLGDLRALFPLAIAGAIVWALWLYRVIESRRYRPVVNDFRTTTSVVVPSFHEDVPILMRCLDSWLEQDPTEIIVVLDVADTEAYEKITALRDRRVRPILFKHAGKRSALGVGIRAARHEILVLVDSDTSWQPGLLDAVQMPFEDPQVGAVSTHQNVFERRSSIWRRIADWLVNLRYYDYVPAMARVGAVACVSGRTGAYRRSVVLPVLDNLENEFFLGRRCIAGDDGRLTWLVLASGYRTTHQSTARALSMFPSGLKAFVKQRVRWSRNSYRCYLTAIYKGWLWRVPFVTKITVLQILLTPVTMGITLGYLLLSRLELTPVGIGLVVGWLVVTRGVRGYSHLRRHPQEVLLLPLLAVVVVVIALPIKLYSFLTMNRQGWLTRHADTVGGEGQTSADGARAKPLAVEDATSVVRTAAAAPPPRPRSRAARPRPAVAIRPADPALTAPIPVAPARAGSIFEPAAVHDGAESTRALPVVRPRPAGRHPASPGGHRPSPTGPHPEGGPGRAHPAPDVPAKAVPSPRSGRRRLADAPNPAPAAPEEER